MEEKKPKRFPGMKVQPNFGRPKNEKSEYLTYKDLVEFDGIPKPNMSQRQLKTFNKFIQVKEGETHEQWSKRTAHRRVLSTDEINNLGRYNPKKVKKNKRRKYEREMLVVNQSARTFDYLKHYAIVMNYYSIKYGVYKEWLEIGFYFYEGTPFTKTTFENVCVLSFCNSNRVFKHFLKKGWIVPVYKKTISAKNNIKREPTDLYVFHKHFTNKISYLYKILQKITPFRMLGPMSHALSKETKTILHQMMDEVSEINTGKKLPDDILT